MGLIITFAILIVFSIILIIRNFNVFTYLFGCLSITGFITFVILYTTVDHDLEFSYWLRDRDKCEEKITNFDELERYEKIRLISEIKKNNEELNSVKKYGYNIFTTGLYSENYKSFDILEVPNYQLNSRIEKTKN